MGVLEITLLVTVAVILVGWSAYVLYEAKLSRRGHSRTLKGDGRTMSRTLVGRDAYVTTTIRHMGAVTVDDETWTAQTGDGSVIEAGAWVKVVDVQGLKVVVTLREEPEGSQSW